MALVTDIADAVVTELTGGAFSQSFTPQRRVLPEHELAEMKDLRVTVVPRGVEITASSRTTSQHDVQIDVGIQKKIGKATDTEVATLLAWLTRSPTSSSGGFSRQRRGLHGSRPPTSRSTHRTTWPSSGRSRPC